MGHPVHIFYKIQYGHLGKKNLNKDLGEEMKKGEKRRKYLKNWVKAVKLNLFTLNVLFLLLFTM